MLADSEIALELALALRSRFAPVLLLTLHCDPPGDPRPPTFRPDAIRDLKLAVHCIHESALRTTLHAAEQAGVPCTLAVVADDGSAFPELTSERLAYLALHRGGVAPTALVDSLAAWLTSMFALGYMSVFIRITPASGRASAL